MADEDIAQAIAELREDVGPEIVAELIELYDASLIEHGAALEAAMGSANHEAIATHAHALVGSIANFRAAAAMQLMREVEQLAKDGAPNGIIRERYDIAKAEAHRVHAVLRASG